MRFKLLSSLLTAAVVAAVPIAASAVSVPLSIGGSCIGPGFATALASGSTQSFEFSDPAGCFGTTTNILFEVTSGDPDAIVDVSVGTYDGASFIDTLASATLQLTNGLLEFTLAEPLIAALTAPADLDWGIVYAADAGNASSLSAGGRVFFDDGSGVGGGVVIGGPPPPAVPLPAAGWLLLAGIGGMAAFRRRC